LRGLRQLDVDAGWHPAPARAAIASGALAGDRDCASAPPCTSGKRLRLWRLRPRDEAGRPGAGAGAADPAAPPHRPL